MIRLLIPVLLSALIGPGVGQLTNREFKKGWILIGLSLLVLIAFSVWLSRAALPYLPSMLQKLDPATVRDAIQNHVVKDHPVLFYTYQVLLAGLWAFGVVDAFLGARRRQAKAPAVPES